jgi:NAD(P) transhydrogenase
MTKDGKYFIDLEDDVTRGAIVTHKKETLWPNPNPPMLDAAPKKAAQKEEKKVEISPFNQTLKKALGTTAVLASIVGMGAVCPNPAILTMSTIFGLSLVTGY